MVGAFWAWWLAHKLEFMVGLGALAFVGTVFLIAWLVLFLKKGRKDKRK